MKYIKSFPPSDFFDKFRWNQLNLIILFLAFTEKLDNVVSLKDIRIMEFGLNEIFTIYVH